MKKIIIACFLLFVTSKILGGTLSLYLENDVMHDRDHDYSHGTKLSYATDDSWSFYLWQGMYTPENIYATEVIEYDRPYAGWLALGVEKTYSLSRFVHTTELSLGIVGSYSLAEETQIGVHKLLGVTIPQGWDNQLKNEPAILIRHEIKKALWILNNKIVFVPQSEAVVGTVMNYAGIGGDIMFGYRPNPYPNQYHYITVKNKNNFGLYGFVGVRGRCVLWNTLLDGNIWHNSHSVDKEYLVGDAYVGVRLSLPRWSVTIANITRTKEYKTQDGRENFNSISFSVDF